MQKLVTSEEIKKQRLYILQQRINQHAIEISHGMIGTQQKVLVQGVSKKDNMQLQGRTENNRVVNFTLTSSENLIGRLVDILITEAMPNSLRGVLVQSGH